MLINSEIIKKLNPCDDRFNNYLNNYKDFSGSLEDFILLENITYSDKVWVVTRLFTKEQNIKWSILCASKVLSIFEEYNPGDNRPRLALEAAEIFLNSPNQENANAAYAATAATADYAAYAAAANAANDSACVRIVEEEVNLLLTLECL